MRISLGNIFMEGFMERLDRSVLRRSAFIYRRQNPCSTSATFFSAVLLCVLRRDFSAIRSVLQECDKPLCREEVEEVLSAALALTLSTLGHYPKEAAPGGIRFISHYGFVQSRHLSMFERFLGVSLTREDQAGLYFELIAHIGLPNSPTRTLCRMSVRGDGVIVIFPKEQSTSM